MLPAEEERGDGSGRNGEDREADSTARPRGRSRGQALSEDKA